MVGEEDKMADHGSLPEDVTLSVDDPDDFGTGDVREINSDPTQSIGYKAKSWAYGQVPDKYREEWESKSPDEQTSCLKKCSLYACGSFLFLMLIVIIAVATGNTCSPMPYKNEAHMAVLLADGTGHTVKTVQISNSYGTTRVGSYAEGKFVSDNTQNEDYTTATGGTDGWYKGDKKCPSSRYLLGCRPSPLDKTNTIALQVVSKGNTGAQVPTETLAQLTAYDNNNGKLTFTSTLATNKGSASTSSEAQETATDLAFCRKRDVNINIPTEYTGDIDISSSYGGSIHVFDLNAANVAFGAGKNSEANEELSSLEYSSAIKLEGAVTASGNVSYALRGESTLSSSGKDNGFHIKAAGDFTGISESGNVFLTGLQLKGEKNIVTSTSGNIEIHLDRCTGFSGTYSASSKTGSVSVVTGNSADSNVKDQDGGYSGKVCDSSASSLIISSGSGDITIYFDN
jgi:hypothetical protein